MITNKQILTAGAVVLLAAAAALSACGGGSDNGNGGSQASNLSVSDAFFARVLAVISSSPDNTEPVAIEEIAVTTPDDSEPSPL